VYRKVGPNFEGLQFFSRNAGISVPFLAGFYALGMSISGHYRRGRLTAVLANPIFVIRPFVQIWTDLDGQIWTPIYFRRASPSPSLVRWCWCVRIWTPTISDVRARIWTPIIRIWTPIISDVRIWTSAYFPRIWTPAYFPAYFLLDRLYCIPYSVYHIVYRKQCMVHGMTIAIGILENLRLELRRGCLILAVLAELRSEQYGYTLRKALAENGIAIDEGTIYPLLRRLESQGLLLSVWREEEKRNKRFYRLSTDGEQVLDQLLGEWKSMNASLHRINAGGANGSTECSISDPADHIKENA